MEKNIMESLFQSIEKEQDEPLAATVTGTIPAWLHGSLYRNGPAKFEFGEDKFNHFFDGSAMVHRFFIKDGRVHYQNRFLRTDTYLQNMAANRIVVSEFGTISHPDPCKTIFQRFFSYFFPGDVTDNTLVNVFPIGDGLYATTETQYLRRVDPQTLETLDKVDLLKLSGINMATAHPHIESDGLIYNLGSCRDQGYRYALFKMVPPTKDGSTSGDVVERGEIVARIKPHSALYPSYFHSFAMTENYFIVVEQPVIINVLKILTAHLRGVPFHTAIQWDSNFKNIFHIIDRKTGKPVNEAFTYVSRDPFFTFHHGNAYEENGHIVVDLSCYDDGKVFDSVSIEKLREEGFFSKLSEQNRSMYRRYVLPLHLPTTPTPQNETIKNGDNLVTLQHCSATAVMTDTYLICHYDIINDGPLEFPQVNYSRYNGKRYRYLYGMKQVSLTDQQLVKVDVETKEVTSWLCPEGSFPSEPLFVESPDATAEDEGVLVSVILEPGRTENEHKSHLLVLDAQTMTEVGRATVDVRITLGFHGCFIKGV